MYDRYKDISKSITDPDKLEPADNGCVYISSENDYDIEININMKDCYRSFEEVKPYIALIVSHINELDNTVQRFDCSNSMEDEPDPRMRSFPFELAVIKIEKPNFVTFDYWGTDCNSQFDVTFEYKDEKFFLRKFGAFASVPDDWEH